MSEFSVQDVALTGFRIVREHPRALGVWALYLVGLSALTSLITIGLGGGDIASLMSLGAGPSRDPEAAVALMARLAPVYALLLLVTLASNAVLGAAMIRAVLRPEDSRLGFLRLGGDELRQFGLCLLMFLVFLGVYLGLAFGFGIVFGILGSAVRIGSAAMVIAVLFGVTCGLGFVWVRLSLAGPLTFDTRKIDLFGSWALTRGRFLSMAGAYALALSLGAVAYLLCALVIAALGAVLNGGDLVSTMTRPDMTTIRTYFTPFRVAETVLSGMVSALVLPVWLTPPSAIYRHVAPSGLAAGAAFI